MTTTLNQVPNVTAVASYFGANRLLARHVGVALAGCSWVGIPFSGGLSEVPFISARSIVANDAHPHLINLARVMKHPVLGPALYRRLRREVFHPDTLAAAQDYCKKKEAEVTRVDQMDSLFGNPSAGNGAAKANAPTILHDPAICLEWAAQYFISSWMGQGGRSGTEKEFSGPLSVRWDAGGGDSNTRFRSAISSQIAWRTIFRRVNFIRRDGFDFIRDVKDESEIGIYSDAPWVVGGDAYKYTFTTAQHRQLSTALHRFEKATVVLRYGDDPLVRDLYPESHWKLIEQTSKKQSNASCAEILIIKRKAA